MNWFLLLLILKLYATNWAAPIDLVENNAELQQGKQILDNLINKGISVADEANNFIKTSENFLNNTQNTLVSTINESLSEGLQKTTEDVQNFTGEIQKKLLPSSAGEVVESSNETKQPEEINNEEISINISQPIESSTETLQTFLNTEQQSNDAVLPIDSEARSNNIFDPVPEVTTEISNSNTENSDNLYNETEKLINNEQNESFIAEQSSNIEYSAQVESLQDESLNHHVNIEEVFNSPQPGENYNASTQQNSEVSSNTPNIDQQNFTEDLPQLHPEETSTSIPELKQTVDTLAEVTQLEDSTLNGSQGNTEEAPTFKQAVDSSIEDVVEIGSKLGLITEKESNQTSAVSDQDLSNVSQIQEISVTPEENPEKSTTNSLSPVDNSNISQQNSQHILESKDENVDQQTLPLESSTIYPIESSSEVPALKQSIDSFLNQVADISSSIRNTAEEITIDASIIQPATENSSNVDLPTSTNEIEVSADPKHEDTSDKAPTFKQAVDAFIGDVVEIGSKLGLVPEEKSNEQAPEATENENKSLDTTSVPEISTEEATPTPAINLEQFLNSLMEKSKEIANNSDLTKTDVPTQEEESKTEEMVTSTSNSQENLSENQQINPNETQNNESSFFGRSAQTLIKAATEIGSNVGNTVSELLSVSENKPETVTVIPNEISTQFNAPEEQNNLENLQSEFAVSSSQVPLGNFQEDATEFLVNDHEVASINQSTTPNSQENLSENQQINPNETQNYESSFFGRSAQTLIEAAAEIGNNVGNTVSELLSVSENKPESVSAIPNEISTQSNAPEEENNLENLQSEFVDSSSQFPLGNFQEDAKKFLIDDHEKLEEASIQNPNESLSYSTGEITKASVNNYEGANVNQQENEDFTNQVTDQNITEQKSEEAIASLAEHPAEYVEYVPVAVVTEGESKTRDNSEDSLPIETDQLNTETKFTEEEVQQNTETKSTDAEGSIQLSSESNATEIVPENTEITAHEEVQTTQYEVQIDENKESEEHSSPYPSNESETSSSTTELYNIPEATIQVEPSFSTLEDIMPETSTEVQPAIEGTTTAFSKFENTIKTLIEQEKIKHQEKHLNTLEVSQQDTTTLAPSSSTITPLTEDSNTLISHEDTTMLPKKFEEELQMAVKALEETTHHHFEEFQNNLKQAFKKFSVWGTEHERQAEVTTLGNELKGTTSEAQTTQQSPTEATTIKNEDVGILETENVKLDQTFTNEEPHRSGAISQNFEDKFSDNYQEHAAEFITKEVQNAKDVFGKLTELKKTEEEQTTEVASDVITMLSAAEDVNSTQEDQIKGLVMESPSLANNVDENLTTAAENFVKETSEEAKETTTEDIAESSTTSPPPEDTMQKDLNSVTLTTSVETATEYAAQEPTMQHSQIQEENATTETTTAASEEIITLPSPESSLQQMVSFVEHDDTTTVKQEQLKEVEEEHTATSQTQEPLTQAAFMEEQQQQIESTTEHEAQTQTDATSGQTVTTTTNNRDDDVDNDNDTLEQHQQETTTEAEIYSTTAVEEVETTTEANEEAETTLAYQEPEARSLSLPPPKLEYLQNEDGVEVFYGYSIVKHN